MQRNTIIGQQLAKLVKQDKNVPASLTVKMLNRIIYNGQVGLNKFILTNFPEQIDQAKEFETNCAKIAAIIYPNDNSTIVDIPHKELSLFNIESLFQKEFRLKTMNEWSYELFEEKLGNKVEYGIIVGESFSGKTETAKCLAANQGFTVIDMNKITEGVKAKMGGDGDEPFEGEVPIQKIEEAVCETIMQARGSGQRAKFVFDGYTHKSDEEFIGFTQQFGCPDFVLFLSAAERTIKERWCKKNEAEEVPEETLEGMRANAADAAQRREALMGFYANEYGDRVNCMQLNTSNVASLESLTKDLNNKFSPKVVLVNHEKSLGVDNTCSNLAIKYNMIYISAY